jgi:hypothetical protein
MDMRIATTGRCVLVALLWLMGCAGDEVQPGDHAELEVAQATSGTYYYAGVLKAAGTSGYGVGAKIRIENPTIAYTNDMVTSEISLVKGANNDSVVELGYRKYQTPGPTLLIGHWVNGSFMGTAGFVQVSAAFTPGMSLSNYVGQRVAFEIRNISGDWWVWFDSEWVGYFPGSLWNGSFARGDWGHWYGEVYSGTPHVPPLTDMGNGRFGSDPLAAYIDRMYLCTSTANCTLISGALRSENNAAYYSLYYDGGHYLRHGGSGGVAPPPPPPPCNGRRCGDQCVPRGQECP